MKHIPRLFVNDDLNSNTNVSLNNFQKHHIFNVLRLKIEDEILLFNIKSGEWSAKVINIKSGIVVCCKKLRDFVQKTLPSIAFSIIHQSRMSFLLEKITELGVDNIYPLITQYTQYRNINIEKAQQIIIQACEQSKQIKIPHLHQPMNLDNFLETFDYKNQILYVADENTGSLEEIDTSRNSCFLIGPEGGFSEKDLQQFEKYSFVKKILLSDNVLRSETAAIAAIYMHRCIFSS